MENKEQHVDWDGLVYYDGKLKEYIQTTTATKADQDQLRTDLEQLEKLLTTFADSFTTDKKHIYEHIEACKNRSATKEELAAAIITLREEIKTLTGVDLSEYATKEFVEDKLRDIGAVEIPDNLVTTDDIQNLVTREELAEEIGKIAPPDVDLTSLATKEALAAVEAKVESIVIPEVPTNVSELENDAGYSTTDYVDDKVKVVSAHISATRTDTGVTIHYSDIDSTGVTHLYDGTDGKDGTVIHYSTIDTSNEEFSNNPRTFTISDFTDTITYDLPELGDLIITRNSDYWKVTAQGSAHVGAVLVARGKGEKGETPDLSNYYNKTEAETLVSEAVAKLVDSAPEELNTLKELSDAISSQKDVLGTFATKTELEGLATQEFVEKQIADIPSVDLTGYVKEEDLPDTSKFITGIPEEYVTDTELDAKGYLTEHQSLEGLATEQFVADEIAKLDCVSSTTVENIIEEKIEEVVTSGATVSSISYGTF